MKFPAKVQKRDKPMPDSSERTTGRFTLGKQNVRGLTG